MTTAEAPSFERARLELYQLLSPWSFVRVVRPCVQGENGYFHGTGVQHDGTRVWFQKMRPEVSSEEAQVGPLSFKTQPDLMPRPGDVLMGRTVPTKQRSDKLLFYFSAAGHMEKLRMLVEQGTSQSEAQLAHELRARKAVDGGVDDAWAVARLILFGNVNAFAEQHLKTSITMRLSCDALTFVHMCAIDFDDPSIWDAFVALVPDAQPPLPAALPQPIVRPLNLAAASQFVGRRRAPVPPPRSPQSPPFYDYMKSAPLYNPVSLPFPSSCDGESPPYNPSTPPPMSPMAEAYSPTSPGYDQSGSTTFMPPLPLPPPAPMSPPPPPPAQPPSAAPYTVESVMSLLQSVAAVQAQQHQAQQYF